MIKFICDGEEGIIDHSGFVRWGGFGFHLDDVHFNPLTDLMKSLEDAYLKALFDSIRI